MWPGADDAGTGSMSCWLTHQAPETTGAQLNPGTLPLRLCEGRSQPLLSDDLESFICLFVSWGNSTKGGVFELSK